MGPQDDTGEADKARIDVARPRYSTGAIGAVSQSIADLKSRSVTEIQPDLIDAGGLGDRVEETEGDHIALVESIRDYGQQVPILVRPHPDTPGRFQVVYGRRRLAALRSLGQPAKALIRDLDDAALVMAQGQENSARRDLSFIEKCNFARQMRDADYDRKAICAALNVDKTLISRMISIVDRIPIELIEEIGSAPNTGRDRWSDFADRFELSGDSGADLIAMMNLLGGGKDSDGRFEAAFARLPGPEKMRRKPSEPVRNHRITSPNGLPIARVSHNTKATVITLPADNFGRWLADHLLEIHTDWVSRGDDEGSEKGPGKDPSSNNRRHDTTG